MTFRLSTICFLMLGCFVIARAELEYDAQGYVMYCPCMGRFGNQADHFLGALSFAKRHNRTFIIPPWIKHNFKAGYQNDFVPFTEWFKIENVQRYHRVITMEDFMKNLAPTLWPLDKRTIYCHKGAMERSEDKATCPAKTGKPFAPFWDNFKIDFVKSASFPPHLGYASTRMLWDEAFPLDKHLVLTFMGAPASYPVAENDRKLQAHVEWADEVSNFVTEFTSKNLRRPFVGIHLRVGVDWKRACEHVGEGTNFPFMSSPQCVGYGSHAETFTQEMCFPKKESIVKEVTQLVKEANAKSLFIATDSDSYESDFKKTFKESSLNVDVVKLKEDFLIKDMALLIEADKFIGSCGSSVTAFVVRKREILGKSCEFFGKPSKKAAKTEL